MIDKIIEIAINAGNIVLDIRKKGFETKIKSNEFDFVTTADLKSEEYIIQRLNEEFPKDFILSEERGNVGNVSSERVWMVDPLDGTKDFKNKGEGFSIMIGLCIKGKPILGVVYAPAKNLLYFAEKEKGSYLRINSKDIKLNVNSNTNLKNAIMVTRITHGEKREEDKYEELFETKTKIQEVSVGLKLGLIASGKADFHVNTNFRASKWDTCAPQIILEEAGGKITDFKGKALNYKQSISNWKHSYVASNNFLHEEIIATIKKS